MQSTYGLTSGNTFLNNAYGDKNPSAAMSVSRVHTS